MSTTTQAAKKWPWRFNLAILVLLNTALISFNRATYAQIIPDDTLGAECSVVTPAGVQDLIEGGAIRESILFHSFSQFNVNNAQQVYFANPIGIANILTRVTGSNSSNILGTLGVLGSANLFLINPNGIYFGPNARLDIAGSFTATTANSVIFDNYTFSATNPEAPPLLTISVTPGVQYGANHPARTIHNQGNLSVGQDLSLIGGNLNLENQLHAGKNLTLVGTDMVRIRDSISEPFIASANGTMLVQGDRIVDIFALNHPNSGLFSVGDMVLRSANTVGGDAHYWSGGQFRIEQLDGNLGSLYSPNDPIIRANGDVSLASYFGASLHILAGGAVSIPGAIAILAPDPTNAIVENITLSDGSTVVSIDGRTQPTLDIRAGIDWTQLGGLPGNTVNGFIFPSTPTFNPISTSANIQLGNVTILGLGTTGKVFLTNQYQPNPLLTGSITVGSISTGSLFGDGGALVIDSKGAITLNGSVNTLGGEGKGGDITLLANNEGGRITINSPIDVSGLRGNGGNVTFAAKQDITLSRGSGITSTGLLGGQIDINSGGTLSIHANLLSNSSSNRTGFKGGDIQLEGRSVLVSDGAILSSTTQNNADAGNLMIEATDSVSFAGVNSEGGGSLASSAVLSGAQGNGGNVSVEGRFISFNDGGSVASITDGLGNAGNVRVEATDTVSFSGVDRQGKASGAASAVLSGGEGNGGNLEVTGARVFLDNGALLNSSTDGTGNAGNVTIAGEEIVSFAGVNPTSGLGSGVGSAVLPGAEGNGGEISVTGTTVLFNDGALLFSSSGGVGNAGSVTVQATDTVSFAGVNGTGTGSGAATLVAAGAVGRGGDIAVTGATVLLDDGAYLSSGTFGEGSAGNVAIEATDTVSFAGVDGNGTSSSASSAVFPGAVGQGGELSVTGATVLLNDRAILSSSTFAEGNAGTLRINATDSLSIDNSFVSSAVEAGAVGNANDIEINTRSLSLTNQSLVSSSTSGQGNAGRVVVEAPETVSLDNSIISTAVNPGAVAQTRSNIDIQTNNISLTNDAQISASTSGSGPAGDIKLTANQVTVQSGSQVSAATSTDAGGSITVQADRFTATSGGQLLTTTSGNAEAGTIALQVRDSITLEGEESGLFASSSGTGKAGGLTLSSEQLSLQNGAELNVAATGSADAGNIQVSASDITLNNSTISAETNSGGEGNITLNSDNSVLLQNQSNISAATVEGKGGQVTVNAQNSLAMANNSEVTSSATGEGGIAGNIEISTTQLELRDRSLMNATTRSGDGGNINLTVRDILFLRQKSDISTTAGEADAGGNGGNININVSSGFIVAIPTENSDITANAFYGNGGRIRITTQGILGLEFRDRLTPLSDITAFTKNPQRAAQGTVELITPGIDPSRGLTQLPSTLTDPTEQIVAGCASDRDAKFTITGRGGLPEDPRATLRGTVVLQDFRATADSSVEGESLIQNSKFKIQNQDAPNPQSQLVEAQGWMINEQGKIELVANSPQSDRRFGNEGVDCSELKQENSQASKQTPDID